MKTSSKKFSSVALYTSRRRALSSVSSTRDKQKVAGWDKGVKTPAGTGIDVTWPSLQHKHDRPGWRE